MSTLTPDIFSDPLSGFSETPQDDDLEAMILRLDKKWGELKELLRVQEHARLPEPPDHQIGLGEVAPAEKKDESLNESEENLFLSDSKVKVDVTPREAEAIVGGVEKLGEETRILESLDRLEKQNRGLIFYSVFCTLLFLGMLFSHYLLMQNGACTTETLRQEPPSQVSAAATAPDPANLSFQTLEARLQEH